MEEVLAWLIPFTAQRPQAPTFFLFFIFYFLVGGMLLKMQVRELEKGSCHQYGYRRLLESCQVVNYVNVCSINKMHLNTLLCQ